MSADGMQVPIEAIRRHAGSVQHTADQMGQARAAVGEITMDTGAYGQLCQFLPAILEPVFAAAAQALDGSVEALGETVAGLRTVAGSQEGTDAGNAQRITTAGRGLPELPL